MKINVKTISRWKLLLDVAMITVLSLMYNHHALGMTFHEVGGLILIGVFVIHILLNRKWVAGITKKLFQSGPAVRTKISYVINLLLVISFLIVGISGILISKVVFHLNISTGGINWKGLHIGAAALAMVLVGIHAGMHNSYITGILKKMIPLPKAVAKGIGICLFLLFVGYGAYSIQENNFIGMLERPFISQSEGGAANRGQESEMEEDLDQAAVSEAGFSDDMESAGEIQNHEGSGSGTGGGRQSGLTAAIQTFTGYGSIAMFFACATILIEWLIGIFGNKRRKQKIKEK